LKNEKKQVMNCPVCNYPGLPDYQSVRSVCPNCGSDLKGFLLINQVEQESESKLKRLKLLCAGLSVVLLIFLFGSIFLLTSISKQNPVKSNQQLDSTAYYSKLVKDLRQELMEKPKTAEVYYIIKRNDNLSQIAKLFYNDGSRTKQIMTDNNLQKGYNLLPGDTLILKIKTK
jgi:nucleoid-associated protein YgaU